MPRMGCRTLIVPLRLGTMRTLYAVILASVILPSEILPSEILTPNILASGLWNAMILATWSGCRPRAGGLIKLLIRRVLPFGHASNRSYNCCSRSDGGGRCWRRKNRIR